MLVCSRLVASQLILAERQSVARPVETKRRVPVPLRIQLADFAREGVESPSWQRVTISRHVCKACEYS